MVDKNFDIAGDGIERLIFSTRIALLPLSTHCRYPPGSSEPAVSTKAIATGKEELGGKILTH